MITVEKFDATYTGSFNEHFGLKEFPFTATPDTKFFYYSEQHIAALANLLYGVNQKKGFIVLTGEVGTGKTMVVRLLLDVLAGKAKTALIFNPKLSPSALLSTIVKDFGIEPKPGKKKNHFDMLNEFLLDENKEGRQVCLVIDEAQGLSLKALELVRLISNLETHSEKLIQIILSGQPELWDLLKDKRIRQLRQRVNVCAHLKGLNLDEVKEYINCRLKLASKDNVKIIFSEEAVNLIYEYSKGVPRLVNAICDKSLLAAYTQGGFVIDGTIIEKAVSELHSVLVD